MTFSPVLHNEYELKSFPNTTEQVILDAKAKGLSQVLIANHDNLFQAPQTYRQIKENGLKPVMGAILENRVFVAQNFEGYQRLSILVSNHSKEDFSWDTQNMSHIIELPQIVEVDFLNSEDQVTWEFLQKFAKREVKDKPSTLLSFNEYQQAIEPETFKQISDLLETVEVYDFPNITTPQLPSVISKEELWNVANQAILEKIEASKQSVYLERLKKEFSVIEQLNFLDYFGIEYILADYLKREKITQNTGRGSAVGSLFSYLLGITKVDPIQYGLHFERFLNINRNSLPDVDIDIPASKRKQVYEFVEQKFGPEFVSRLTVFSSFRHDNLLAAIAQVYHLDEQQVSYLDAKFKGEKPTTRNTLSAQVENTVSEVYSRLINHVINNGVHPAGIIISSFDLKRIAPVTVQEQTNVIQLDSGESAYSGLVKFDILNLNYLDIVEKINSMLARDNDGKKIALEKIKLNDSKVFEIFAKGFTKGIFQFESSTAVDLVKAIRPQNIDELAAINALNRPGAINYSQQFIANKNSGKIPAVNPVYDEVTKETYGLLIYQEQVMELAQKMAGMSGVESDSFRRAISKKDDDLIQQQRNIFIDKSVANGFDRQQATNIFSSIQEFSGYGFNKSHAVAYAIFAYQMAFFKAYFPSYFYAVSMQDKGYGEFKLEMAQKNIQLSVPDIDQAQVGFSATKDNPRMINLGLSNVSGISVRDAASIVASDEKTNLTALREQFGDKAVFLVAVGFFDQHIPNRSTYFEKDLKTPRDKAYLNFIQSDASTKTAPISDSKLNKYRLEKNFLGFGITKVSTAELTKDGVPINMLDQFINKNVNLNGVTAKIYDNSERIDKNGGKYLNFELTDGVEKISSRIFATQYLKFQKIMKNNEKYNVVGKIEEYKGKISLIISQIGLLG